MYYETIKVLDCTIRDGGLVNKHDFSLEFVRRLYTLLTAAGVDYMEMGYKNSPELFDPKEYGPWKFCEDDLLWKVKDGIDSKMKMAVMADVGRVNMDAVKPASESPYQMFRVASYVKNIDKGISMVNAFHDMGYETTLNIMAVSRDRGPELDQGSDPPQPREPPCDDRELPESYEIVVKCEDENDQKTLYDRLVAEGYNVRLCNI